MITKHSNYFEFPLKEAYLYLPQVLDFIPPAMLQDDNYIVRFSNNRASIYNLEFGYPEDDWQIR